ncbi:hypothetical protein V1522DRAFT_250336 [Lipomyces starkeyi]
MSHCFQPSAAPSQSYPTCQRAHDPTSAGGLPYPDSSPGRCKAGYTTNPVSGDSALTTSRKRQRPGGSRVIGTYPRMRALTACQLCRSKKVKCNNARPSCSNCEKSKATCVYGDSQDISSYVSLLLTQQKSTS